MASTATTRFSSWNFTCRRALLRTLRRYPEQKIICGPSLLVDEILRASGASSISDLVTGVWNDDIGPSRLIPPSKTLQVVYNSPRIGLDLSSRKRKFPSSIHASSSSGRLQTFCGLYTALRESNGYPHDSAKLKQELCRLMRLKESNRATTGILKSFVGSVGKGVCQSSSAYLKMMGTLQRAKERGSTS
ncbi:hypothetical protein EDD16DRAFT_1693901 [Pisolithus croceorrhizus]|nr:hypothetical protein EDD16DRAFT_1696228 [Pisolithus croceorrhizus]KAI6112523.1 hypothetical protein EDD16DRAFT_1693901 [Pisolithus croceorrhizus]